MIRGGLLERADFDVLVDFLGLIEISERDTRQARRSGAGGDAPAKSLPELLLLFASPEESSGERVAGPNGTQHVDARRDRFPHAFAQDANGAASTEREDGRLRAHLDDARSGFNEVIPCQERAIEQAFGFGLVGGNDGGIGFEPGQESIAVGIEERLDALGVRDLDQAFVEVGRGARRKTATEHEPFGFGQAAADGLFELVELFGGEFGARLVELDTKALFVGDGEIDADVVLDGDELNGELVLAEQALEARSGFTARGDDGQSLAAERLDNARGVDATAAGGFAGGEDVSTIIENQTIREDRAVDGRVDCNSYDQASILIGAR